MYLNSFTQGTTSHEFHHHLQNLSHKSTKMQTWISSLIRYAFLYLTMLGWVHSFKYPISWKLPSFSECVLCGIFLIATWVLSSRDFAKNTCPKPLYPLLLTLYNQYPTPFQWMKCPWNVSCQCQVPALLLVLCPTQTWMVCCCFCVLWCEVCGSWSWCKTAIYTPTSRSALWPFLCWAHRCHKTN